MIEVRLTTSDIIARTGQYKNLTSRIGETNGQLEEEIEELEGIIRALKIVSAFIGIAVSIIELTTP